MMLRDIYALYIVSPAMRSIITLEIISENSISFGSAILEQTDKLRED